MGGEGEAKSLKYYIFKFYCSKLFDMRQTRPDFNLADLILELSFLLFSFLYVVYVGLAKLHCGATPPSVMILFISRLLEYFQDYCLFHS